MKRCICCKVSIPNDRLVCDNCIFDEEKEQIILNIRRNEWNLLGDSQKEYVI